jgi:RNA polymerase sigma-70 factor (ECF subfamily)
MLNQDQVLELLGRARGGDAQARGQLLELYRSYLRLVAQTQMGTSLGAHVEASDLVQDALLDAHRGFTEFGGRSEGELLAWLRRILVRTLVDQARYHSAQKRDGKRQHSLEALLEASSSSLGAALGMGSTPSLQASRREQAVLLADALERLSADYREVIVLRNMHKLSFEEVGQRMGRNSGAVRMLWARALEKLGQEMGEGA